MRSWHSKLSPREISALKRSRRCFRCTLFSMYALLRTECTRVVIVASKKRVGKKAVLRNRAKRRIRAALDEVFKEKTVTLDMAIALTREVLEAPFGNLVSFLEKAIRFFVSGRRESRPFRFPPL